MKFDHPSKHGWTVVGGDGGTVDADLDDPAARGLGWLADLVKFCIIKSFVISSLSFRLSDTTALVSEADRTLLAGRGL